MMIERLLMDVLRPINQCLQKLRELDPLMEIKYKIATEVMLAKRLIVGP